jgi:transposase
MSAIFYVLRTGCQWNRGKKVQVQIPQTELNLVLSEV